MAGVHKCGLSTQIELIVFYLPLDHRNLGLSGYIKLQCLTQVIKGTTRERFNVYNDGDQISACIQAAW